MTISAPKDDHIVNLRAGGSRTLELLAIEDEGVSENAPHLEDVGKSVSLWICVVSRKGEHRILVVYIYIDNM